MADFVPPTYLNTKRYARLVVENVRNFQGIQESVKVRALCVDCLHLFIPRFFSRPSTKKRHFSATLLLFNNRPMRCWKGQFTIKGCARHKYREKEMGNFRACPTCGNSGPDFARVWRCNKCGRIYCDRCYSSGCPGCGESYLNSTDLGYIG